jgi:hypothetical protein
MMKQFVVHTILFGIFLTACASQPVNAQEQAEPVFAVSAKNFDDQITFQHKDNTTTIEINSPFGIGSAIFKLSSGAMPERIVLQLHLLGLEEFRLISDQVTIAASVSSTGGLQTQSQRKILGDSEQLMLAFDPLWLNIQIIADSKQIPLEAGYFEVVFPKEFVQASGGSFEIQWIDFYR